MSDLVSIQVGFNDNDDEGERILFLIVTVDPLLGLLRDCSNPMS